MLKNIHISTLIVGGPGDELVYRCVDEWYIKMDWRDRIKNIVGDINWIPDWGNERELEWLENMGDWMISKKRF